ncbi:type IV secretory pathway TraG/TraD family ATPase VirD4 [Nocardia transvalensis]|uniref:Type IV secretory pathway TraG/TraD family ATPase VirD4 n=1 Tax=Nocardia transvalensis TaxID=37333 RepID=A0A7W9PNP0_9NOCA|nr:TraM recognition domain-containing protein [Nocardia transvalensis]MBB5918958.1 type IV secretory pathway TraG/TraD family ATPase VirD4 [Nocardia transvalensis]
MDRSVKAPTTTNGQYRELAGAAFLGVGVPSLVELAGLAVWAAPMYGGPKQDVPLTNPAGLGWHLMATHELAWTGEATAALGTLVGGGLAAVAASAVGVRWACRRCAAAREQRRYRRGRPAHMALGKGRKADRHEIDDRAKYMARGQELDDLCWEAAEAKALSLGIGLREGQAPGVLIGRTVSDNRELFGTFEDLHLDIWGPRQGKSTSRVIPAIMDAPGAVVATSNKRDVVDATRQHRASRGDVWVFDPQGVAEEPASWYWDPCAWVRGDGGDDAQTRAAELADHFSASVDATSSDAFFEPEGEDLLTGLILAAALDQRPITQVFAWITKPDDKTPVQIVTRHGFDLVAGSLASQYNAQVKQRDGVFATAKKMAAILKYRHIREWVCPPAKGERPRRAFDVADFVATSCDTLYLLSEEGKASGGPLVSALAAAVADAGKKEGIRYGTRMPVPLLMVLDEAANIVRWRDLPKQYSHFGSRGIVVMTILQSWAQGVRCWGREGMDALWSAANIKVLGSGLDDEDFLRGRSEAIGSHYELSTSTSQGQRPDSATESTSRVTETTLTVSDLRALPRGRCLVFASGHRPVLVRSIPWMERGDAAEIRASLDAHTPNPTATPASPRLRAVPTSEEDAA